MKPGGTPGHNAVVCGGVLPPTDSPDLHLQGAPAGENPYTWLAHRITPLPTWIFHGAVDDIVPPQGSRDMYAALFLDCPAGISPSE